MGGRKKRKSKHVVRGGDHLKPILARGQELVTICGKGGRGKWSQRGPDSDQEHIRGFQKRDRSQVRMTLGGKSISIKRAAGREARGLYKRTAEVFTHPCCVRPGSGRGSRTGSLRRPGQPPGTFNKRGKVHAPARSIRVACTGPQGERGDPMIKFRFLSPCGKRPPVPGLRRSGKGAPKTPEKDLILTCPRSSFPSGGTSG